MSKAHFPTRLLINRNWAIPAACFSLLLLLFSHSLFSLKPRDSPPSPTPTLTPDLVHLTLLYDAEDKGARTLLLSLMIVSRIRSLSLAFLPHLVVSCLLNWFLILGGFSLLGWTAPGYHFSREFGYGSDSWVLHIEVFEDLS